MVKLTNETNPVEDATGAEEDGGTQSDAQHVGSSLASLPEAGSRTSSVSFTVRANFPARVEPEAGNIATQKFVPASSELHPIEAPIAAHPTPVPIVDPVQSR